ncbi:hypothetical protein BT93_A1850 [Corymbia citriodora subsp. variegata]|nr:hypothetical protein BT93_A1850 [Corymbia citriodora subsp. variegata]
MEGLVARTGLHQRRYRDSFRLMAGCVPFKYRSAVEHGNGVYHRDVEGGWEDDETVEQAASREALEEAGVRGELLHFIGYYEFKSKTLQDELSPEGWCRAAVFALLVKEELESWPEQSTRKRSWLTVAETMECCRYPWMREALGEGFSRWQADQFQENRPSITSELAAHH